MPDTTLSDVLKRFENESDDKSTAYIALVLLCIDAEILDLESDDLAAKINNISPSLFRLHLQDAKEQQSKAVLESYAADLNHLIDVSRQFADEPKKKALEHIISKNSKLGLNHWLGLKVPFWFESVVLNAIGAGAGVFVVYLVVSFLVANGFSGIQITPIDPPPLSPQTAPE